MLYETFIYWVQQLDNSVIDWLHNPKLGLAKDYRDKLDGILTDFEKFGSGKTLKATRRYFKKAPWMR